MSYDLLETVVGGLVEHCVLDFVGKILLFHPAAVIVRILVSSHFFGLIIGVAQIYGNALVFYLFDGVLRSAESHNHGIGFRRFGDVNNCFGERYPALG